MNSLGAHAYTMALNTHSTDGVELDTLTREGDSRAHGKKVIRATACGRGPNLNETMS